jgi:glycosyltransferase involved in cell wall biosynthesis
VTPPRVSVLLPCRNAAPYLPECIASLQAQSYADFEVLAVDDHSTDDTRAVLNDWAARDTRVRVISAAPAGLVNSLNAALSQAQGELIARMDADDIALPARFLKQVELFDNHDELAACGTRISYFPREQLRDGALRYEEWLNALTEPAQLERDVFVECPIAHPTLMLRTRVLRDLAGYCDRGWPEDYDLVLRIFTAGGSLRSVPEILLHWRDRPDSLSRTDPRYSEQSFRRCKVNYLKCWRRELSSVVIWGAGPVGKGFAQEFARQELRVRAFVDVDPRKIGQTIHGAPVIAPHQLNDVSGDALIIAAVSGAAARAEIRAALDAAGRRELMDFVAVA